MSRPTIIYVVRHGQSEFNRDEIVSGHVDPPLTQEGIEQAEATKRKLSAVEFDEVYSSDLQRAVKTAEIIAGKKVPTIHRTKKLRERNFGEFDGRPAKHLEELQNKNRARYDSLSQKERWHSTRHPSIESDSQVSERFIGALAEIAQTNSGKTILVGAHGGTIRTSLIKLGYASLDELPGGSFENAGYIELIYLDGAFTVGKVVGAKKVEPKN